MVNTTFKVTLYNQPQICTTYSLDSEFGSRNNSFDCLSLNGKNNLVQFADVWYNVVNVDNTHKYSQKFTVEFEFQSGSLTLSLSLSLSFSPSLPLSNHLLFYAY